MTNGEDGQHMNDIGVSKQENDFMLNCQCTPREPYVRRRDYHRPQFPLGRQSFTHSFESALARQLKGCVS